MGSRCNGRLGIRVKTLIVYASHSGNTMHLAEGIANVLTRFGASEAVSIDGAPSVIPSDVDLLVVGSPTEGHGLPADARAYLEGLEATSVAGRAAAAFDTRLKWPKLLSGSAAEGIAGRLAAKGARMVGPSGSFIVTMVPELETGELERAEAWAAALGEAVQAKPA